MRRGECLLLLALTLAGVARAQEAPVVDTPKAASEHAVKGYQLQQVKRYDEALAEYELALRFTRNFPDVHWNMGLIYRERGQWDRAAAVYRELLTYLPDDPNAAYSLAQSLNELGEYDEALRQYDRVLLLDPYDTQAANGKGIVYLRRRQYEAALAEFLRAVDVTPQYALYNLACTYSLQGDREKALLSLERASPFMDEEMFEHAKTDTDLDPIRQDPRFQAILRGTP